MRICRHCPFALLTLAGIVVSSQSLWADGFLLRRQGTYVPEKEQHAYIEWENGRERLYVATRTEASQGPALWVVPIPSSPEQVTVEPVEVFPQVGLTTPFVKPARDHLTKAAELTLMLDSALLCPLYMGMAVEAKTTFGSVSAMVGARGDGVTIHQHLEKLGLVIEVLSARDLEAFDRYLRDKEIGVRAKEIEALQPYFDATYTFICAWPADSSQAQTARALRIDFAFPRVYYPMRASRVYTADIKTSIFVRGWSRPSPLGTIPGQRCHYVMAAAATARTEPLVLRGAALGANLQWKWGPNEPHTRIELPRSPREWTEDLQLEPEAPAAIAVASAVERLGPLGLWLAGGLQGVLFLGWLPLALFPRSERRASDWRWACLVGAALTLSLIPAALLFAVWMRGRDPKRAPRVSPTWQTVTAFASALVGALAITIILTGANLGILGRTVSSFLYNPGPAALFLFAVAFVMLLGLTACAVVKTERKGVVFLGFVLLHLSVNLTVLIALEHWLAEYA